mgnify:CR=1 FL=1
MREAFQRGEAVKGHGLKYPFKENDSSVKTGSLSDNDREQSFHTKDLLPVSVLAAEPALSGNADSIISRLYGGTSDKGGQGHERRFRTV